MDRSTDKLPYRWKNFPGRDVSSNHVWILEIALLAIAFAFGIFGLDRSPTVWFDETFYNEVAYQLAYHGEFVSGLEQAAYFKDQPFLYPPLHAVFYAVVFRIFGFGIWQVRLTCLFFHLSSALIIFLTAKVYFRHEITGVISSALFLLDPSVVKSWRSGRPDAMAVFLGVTALYILIRALRMGTIPHTPGNSKSMCAQMVLLLYTVAGMIVGFACITHPNSLSFAVSGLIFLIFSLNSWKERGAAIAMYGFGGVLGIAPYGIFILRHSDAFTQQYLALSAKNTSVNNFLRGIVAQIQKLIVYYRLFPFLPCVYIVGLVWGLRSTESRIFSFAGCWALALYFGVIHNSHPLPYVVPILALGAGGLVRHKAQDTRCKIHRPIQLTRHLSLITSLLVFLTLANGLGILALRTFATIWQWEGRSHSAFVNEWRDVIGTGASVAAPPGCFYAALSNGNTYRYHKIVEAVGTADHYGYRSRLVEDNVEYLVLPANADLHDYLLDEHVGLFQYVNSIRRPMRHLTGIEVGVYNFDIYQRRNSRTRPEDGE